MRVRTILCLVLALSGYAVSGRPASQARQNASTPEQSPPMQSARVAWRVVAERRAGVAHCPPVKGWKAANWLSLALRPPEKEYPPVSEEQAERDAVLAIETDPALRKFDLDRFCVYTAAGDGKFPLDRLPDGLIDASYGEMALVPAGSSDDAQAKLAQHFLDQASGTPVRDGVPLWTPRLQNPPVRLVFLDTQADGEGVPHVSGPSQHGYTLVHLADRLVCRGLERCPVELATRLALPRQDPDHPVAKPGGGSLGLVDELAQAITSAVHDSSRNRPDRRLILNLSVGWDEELLGRIDRSRRGGSREEMNPSMRLVYQALLYAREHEALVIAAAGNRRGGSLSVSPLLPAAWELSRPPGIRLDRGRKLIYAVGGVDWQGLPLPNARYRGLPSLVAFGDHASVITQSPDDPGSIYTGSSVSAAVASATAAVVWQLRPDLRPAEVMELIYQSGDVLRSRASYYGRRLPGPAPRLRRLSLCNAVRQACASGKCAAPECRFPSRPADLSSLVSDTRRKPHAPFVSAALPAGCAPVTTPSPLFFVPSPSPTEVRDESACPMHLLPDRVSQQWVAPQPDQPPCPGCTFEPPPTAAMVAAAAPSGKGGTSGYVLTMDILPDWRASNAIESVALDVDRYSAGKFMERTTYVLPDADLDLVMGSAGPHHLLLPEIGQGDSLAGCTASLNFKVTLNGRTFSIQNPVYVDP